MAKNKKRVNPFYVLLVLAGIAFAITACAYGVMAVRQLHAGDYPLSATTLAAQGVETDAGLVRFMDQHGARLMFVELAVLGLATVAAMGTDRVWTGED